MTAHGAWRAVAGCILGTLAGAGAASAQVPDTFTNLQVLPKDVARRDLVAAMRGIAGDLGVRCNHCHVGPDDLQGMDFASDEKSAKRAAREMLRMTRAVAETVARLPAAEEATPAVTCYNCHRGTTSPPRDIRLVLAETAESQGIEQALATYKRLREQHYGQGRYDFSERSLNALAQRSLERDRKDDALAALRLNREYYPSSAPVEAAFGAFYLRTGDKEQARAAFKRALELDPEDFVASWGLQQVEAAKTP